MSVVRFEVQCKPGSIEQALTARRGVIGPSRQVDGGVSFDIARDLSDPNSIVAPEIALLPDLLPAEPEATVFHVSSSEPWGS